MGDMVVIGGLFLAVIFFAVMAVACLYLFRRKGRDYNYVFLSDTAAMGRSFERREDRQAPWALIYVNISLQQVRSHHSNAEAVEVYRFIREYLMAAAHSHPGGMIAKVDGKNYLLMLREEPEEAEKIATGMEKAIRRYIANHGIVSTPDMTFGYYRAKTGQVRFEEARRRAKQVYKLAAANGRGWGVYEYETAHEMDKVENLEKTILRAIDSDSFFLEFQPFIEVVGGTVVGGEVLSRLNDEREGLVMPRYFLQAVKNSSCHSRFDYYIFEKTCKWASCQSHKGLKYLSINFSRYSMSEPDFARNITRITDEYALPHGVVAVEITEEERESSHPNVLKNLNALHEAGFIIFLDDFGSGFTSFDDLQNYSIDVVKIDKKILDQAGTEKGRIIFENMAGMAKQLGCTVLCEGVETAEQVETARAAGCDLIQGFYYYRALPADEFSRLLGRRAVLARETGPAAAGREENAGTEGTVYAAEGVTGDAPEEKTDQKRLEALGVIPVGPRQTP